MNKLLTALFLSFATLASAETFRDYSFQQERMMIASDGIYILSSFENSDNVTAYSLYGDLLWDTPFHAKITSWQIIGNDIVVFSKHRQGYKTYLTCLDRYSGRMVWQKP